MRRVAGCSLKRMAKSVAEIEQGAHAALGFVLGDNARLHLATRGHRPDACLRVASKDGLGIRFQPNEKWSIADEPVFRHFGIAGGEFALGERVEKGDVNQDRARLMKGANEILAMRRIDSGLAANGRFHLRQEGRRNLDEIDSAPEYRRGKSGDVA